MISSVLQLLIKCYSCKHRKHKCRPSCYPESRFNLSESEFSLLPTCDEDIVSLLKKKKKKKKDCLLRMHATTLKQIFHYSHTHHDDSDHLALVQINILLLFYLLPLKAVRIRHKIFLLKGTSSGPNYSSCVSQALLQK